MKKFLLAGAVALTMSAAQADQHGYDAVRDYQGDVITNNFNNCVVTKWQGGTGCGDQTQFGTELLNVYFNFDKSGLTPAAKSKLDQVVELLESAKDVNSIDIIGYADYLGNPAYNDALSQRRAESVRNYIESRGYFNTRNVDVIGLGEEQPMTDCTGLTGGKLKACLWRDRRVEIQLNYVQ